MLPGFSVQDHKRDPVPNEQWLAFKEQAHRPGYPWILLVFTKTLSQAPNLLLHVYSSPVNLGEF